LDWQKDSQTGAALGAGADWQRLADRAAETELGVELELLSGIFLESFYGTLGRAWL
jgi:hypothetical protein